MKSIRGPSRLKLSHTDQDLDLISHPTRLRLEDQEQVPPQVAGQSIVRERQLGLFVFKIVINNYLII